MATVCGSGCGVDGPTKESVSSEDGSEGGVVGSLPPAIILASMNMCAPAFDLDLVGLYRASVASNVLRSSVSFAEGEGFWESGIKPWQARAGVGGIVMCLKRL